MSRRRKFLILGIVAVVVVAGVVATRGPRDRSTLVRIERVERRDLVATVTASGQISPETSVDVASDITGRIIQIDVKEGDWVERNQFLLRIDPTQFEAQVARAQASLSSMRANAVQARVNRDQAKRALDRSMELRRTNANLVSDEQLELAQQQYDVSLANHEAQEYQVAQAQASLDEANEQLAKTVLRAPMAGKVTRLAVETGEVALASTFSRETGLLMTIADLSVILINVRVDETDVIRLAEGDSAEITIDAFRDTTFVGRITNIAQSAIQVAAGGSGDRAVDYDVEITMLNPPLDIRPDLSGTAKIVTDIRAASLSVPIVALTVREHLARPAGETDVAADTQAVDTEGVFVIEQGIAYFRPVKIGITGAEHFEIVSGLSEGDSIVAGPYQTVREMSDSTAVRSAEEGGASTPRQVARAPRSTGGAPPAAASELPPAEAVREGPLPLDSVAPPPGTGTGTMLVDQALPEPTSTPAGFTVQVAAVRTSADAETWVTRLRTAGYEPDVVRGDDGLYKVRVGRFQTLEQSQEMARELRWSIGGEPFAVARS